MGSAERTGVAGVLLAAGRGTRLGGEPKAFLRIGGAPILAHALRAVSASGVLDRVVLVVPAGYEEAAEELVRTSGIDLPNASVCAGGGSRPASVRLALLEIPPEAAVVVCHDAARPFATPGLFRRVVARFPGPDGVVPVVPSPDTVKRLRDGRVAETIPRPEVGLAQTPQAFSVEALVAAHRLAEEREIDGTDDAVLLEAAGYSVEVVEGEESNFKITTPEDLRRAEAVLREVRT
jgi:2-C-methyl-D-erythritol 4-phosphate cytidylyltransferase